MHSHSSFPELRPVVVVVVVVLAVAVVWTLVFRSAPSSAQDSRPSVGQLDAAIAAMRHVVKMGSWNYGDARPKELTVAWSTLQRDKVGGRDRVLAEVRAVEAAG